MVDKMGTNWVRTQPVCVKLTRENADCKIRVAESCQPEFPTSASVKNKSAEPKFGAWLAFVR
jgi:hypothetical protein